jgi:hypothetical protein
MEEMSLVSFARRLISAQVFPKHRVSPTETDGDLQRTRRDKARECDPSDHISEKNNYQEKENNESVAHFFVNVNATHMTRGNTKVRLARRRRRSARWARAESGRPARLGEIKS